MVVGALMDPGYKKVKATTDRETSTTRRFSHRYKRFAPTQLEHERSLSLYNTVPALTLITLASRCQHRPRLSLTQALITGVSPISRNHMSPPPPLLRSRNWRRASANERATQAVLRGRVSRFAPIAAARIVLTSETASPPTSCPWRRKAINKGNAVAGGGRSCKTPGEEGATLQSLLEEDAKLKP